MDGPKRRRRIRPFYLWTAGIAVVLCLLGYTIYKVCTAPLPPIQIAVATSLSGLQAKRGTATLDAVHLCFAEVNRRGGVQGHPLEAVPYDDEGNPDVAVENAKKIGNSPALAVIGHYLSVTAVPAGQIYKAFAIPAITGSASAPGVTADNPYYFRTGSDNSSLGHLLAAYAINVLGQKRPESFTVMRYTESPCWLHSRMSLRMKAAASRTNGAGILRAPRQNTTR